MVVGGPERVRAGLEEIVAHTQADELILVSDQYRQEDRLLSFKLLSQARDTARAER
jgi:alkanesulfonate monooxygenase SsuD/methylene tetrahydromethanopterin reductase-like flavin-dependent oxidoreductase (luciferase family)